MMKENGARAVMRTVKGTEMSMDRHSRHVAISKQVDRIGYKAGPPRRLRRGPHARTKEDQRLHASRL